MSSHPVSGPPSEAAPGRWPLPQAQIQSKVAGTLAQCSDLIPEVQFIRSIYSICQVLFHRRPCDGETKP